MPRPVYIICSESGAEDKRTNRFSIFNVVDRMTVTPIPIEAGRPVAIPKFQCRVTIAWMREDGDPLEYEGQIAIIRPDETEEVLTNIAVVFENERPVSRVILDMSGVPDLGQASGLVKIEGRLRRPGTVDWVWRQDYPIVYNVTNMEPAPAVEK